MMNFQWENINCSTILLFQKYDRNLFIEHIQQLTVFFLTTVHFNIRVPLFYARPPTPKCPCDLWDRFCFCQKISSWFHFSWRNVGWKCIALMLQIISLFIFFCHRVKFMCQQSEGKAQGILFPTSPLICELVFFFQKMNRRLHLSKTKHSKFNESGQLAAFYLFSFIWGCSILTAVRGSGPRET